MSIGFIVDFNGHAIPRCNVEFYVNAYVVINMKTCGFNSVIVVC